MLNKICLIFGLLIGVLSDLQAQITKDFKILENQGFNLVVLDFNVYKGVSNIKREVGADPLHIHSHLSKVNILPSFSYQIKDETMYANLVHRNVESESLGKSLSYKLFPSSNDDFGHSWFVDLNSNFLYNLNLNFGVGVANIDLSQIPVANCMIRSASADINFDYGRKTPNTVRMDTLSVLINMGNLHAKKLNLFNAKKMNFEVNYGTMDLNFSGGMTEKTHLHAVVGAGKINITLPDESQPFIIKIKSTAMCRTYIPKHLKDIGNKTYISKSFREDAPNLMELTLDVSVGSVTLK
ncbi:hypothetical protein [Mongoliitalea daihaiensis]|uniref:hypothetical protein n=1 Tax=Mongoliitalea daihaiensis TaxID=2782006 RepID=UPI001F20E7E6|nr:hypothetical protein [Mongoliitalea daihaiensis]UJP65594.1 hypothetical protein IPZ59_02905 [Mongoliitalea daihaiensis]